MTSCPTGECGHAWSEHGESGCLHDDCFCRSRISPREWRFGPRGKPGHRIVPSEGPILSCLAVSPDGVLCGRSVNRVQSTGVLRHNPRPYGRSMKYKRHR